MWVGWCYLCPLSKVATEHSWINTFMYSESNLTVISGTYSPENMAWMLLYLVFSHLCIHHQTHKLGIHRWHACTDNTSILYFTGSRRVLKFPPHPDKSILLIWEASHLSTALRLREWVIPPFLWEGCLGDNIANHWFPPPPYVSSMCKKRCCSSGPPSALVMYGGLKIRVAS